MADIRRVLLVEDEALIAMRIEYFLKAAGVDYRIASNHKRAVDAYSDFHPDIVLLDYYLAGGDNGMSIAKHIRQHDNTPIVFMTAHSNIKDVVFGEGLSNVFFIEKPVHLSNIMALLQEFFKATSD